MSWNGGGSRSTICTNAAIEQTQDWKTLVLRQLNTIGKECPEISVRLAYISVPKVPARLSFTLATVEYRMGSYQEAIQAALKSVELSPQAFPGDYAILAMSYSELGDTENANDYRKRFHESMQLNDFKNDEDCKSLSSEVERTFESELPSKDVGQSTPVE